MKGDRVEILVDAGDGVVERFEIEATRAGHRLGSRDDPRARSDTRARDEPRTSRTPER